LNNAGTTLYVADQGNHQIDIFPVGSGIAQDFTGVDAVLNPSGLGFPNGVAVDGSGNIYTADYNFNQMIEMNSSGTVIAAYRAGLNQPTNVALDSQGNLYILDLTQITKLGPGFTGTPFQFGSGAVSYASGLCVRGTDVFVADTQDNRVDGWTNLGAGTFSVPTTMPSGTYPNGIVFDSTGRYAYVSEQSNQLEVYDTTGGVWTKVAACYNASYNQPDGVAVDGNGNFYISETLNSQVEEFAPIPCVPTPVPTPTPVYPGSNPPASGECFVYPSPAKGDHATVSYDMAEPGQVTLRVWNEKAELVDTVTDSKSSSGVQTTPFTVAGYSTGVYFYSLVLNYGSGNSHKIGPQKFVVIH
jgi:streptogramin lyase